MINRPRRGGFGLILLASQIMNFGVGNIPPVTFILIVLQTLIYMDMTLISNYFPSANAVCMSTYLVTYRKEWKRLFLATLFHADDMHLYFNMLSLLWKGSMLEKRFLSVYFAYLIVVFTTLTSLTYVGLNMFLDELLQDHSYSTICAVGFSGVLFALKVLTTHYTPSGLHYVFGFIPVPSRMIYWVELILIYFLTPNASFTGHLAGILVGLAYIKGPLKFIMNMFMRPGIKMYYSGSGTSGRYNFRPRHGQTRYNTGHRSPRQSSFGDLSEDEQTEIAIQNSLSDSGPSHQSQPGIYPDLDELRQRRLQRYN